MLRVQKSQSGGVGLGTSILWPEDWSLEQLVAMQFSYHPTSAQEQARWSHMLNAETLERIGNFTIVWTNDLQDHLLLDEDDGSIRIYHHATVLRASIECSVDTCFPNEMLEETLQVLALLLPSRVHRGCGNWFRAKLKEAVKQKGRWNTVCCMQSWNSSLIGLMVGLMESTRIPCYQCPSLG